MACRTRHETCHGQEQGYRRAFQPKDCATKTKRCPIKFSITLKTHRPIEMNKPESPFYLAVRHNRSSQDNFWYMKSPLGKNEIGKFLSTAAQKACLQKEGKQITNHSVRKTCISRLLDADNPENFVAQLSGHKNTESLQSYKSASSTHQKRMSLTLCRARSGSEESTVSSVQDLQMASCSSSENALTSTPQIS